MRKTMRSKKERTLRVDFIDNGQGLPQYIGLIQHHFEKSRPVVASKKEATLNAPLDLLNMVIAEGLLSELESIEVVYRKRE